MTDREHVEHQVFVSPRGSRVFVVRALAAMLLVPAMGWTAGLVLGGTGTTALPRLPGAHRWLAVTTLPSARAREASLDRIDRGRGIRVTSHRTDADGRARKA